MMRRLVCFAVALCLSCEKTPNPPPVSPGTDSRQSQPEATPAERLKQAQSDLRASKYAVAEPAFGELLRVADANIQSGASLGLAELYLVTGRYSEAVKLAERASDDPQRRTQAVVLEARAQRASGDLKAAEATLSRVSDQPEARAARLLLGEVLLEQGQRELAEPVLMTLIEDYNSDRVAETDGPGLALVGRAAHLLRAPRDANDAFNQAEQATSGHIPTLLWRAELFLEKHDPGHAEEVVREVLKTAPLHPEALLWLAEVRLEQAFDFDEAERLARRVLSINQKHPRAHGVLAGIALRDMELELAEERVREGLVHRARDLELLSLLAAVRFLADDESGFQQAVKRVLALNAGYSKVYQIVGEYAEWEHRYEEIVEMMEEAVRIDPGDANAHAKLGLNLIRAGEDAAGIVSLRTAFDLDPFNVRVFNTLNLYEKTIKQDYTSVERGRFRIRYPKAEMALLDRYVPELLERAYEQMVQHYGFEPEAPIGIELYASREHFSVRTSGLPRTAIQGVCFGRTLASMSLGEEKFNLGMTLWHELAHVFHIQLSKYHVPRWFTEGLAEHETIIARAEWSREQDPDLFEALRSQRIPKLLAMSRAFTRAEQVGDVATAYYASSRILGMFVEQHGMGKMAEMLRAWGKGVRSHDVLAQVLGKDPELLDKAFREHVARGLKRYQSQFVPMLRAEPLDKLELEIEQDPDNPAVLLRFAVSAWRQGKVDEASRALDKLLELAPKLPDVVYLAGRLAMEAKPVQAERRARELVTLGHDGYWTQLLLAESLLAQNKPREAAKALDAGVRFDPSQAEALSLKYKLARAQKDTAAQRATLVALAKLEQHAGALYARLLEMLNEAGDYQESVGWAEAALWADLSSFRIHAALATAFDKTGAHEKATFEWASAALCEAPKPEKASVHLELIRRYRRSGQRQQALEQAELLKTLDPGNAELKALGL